LYDLFRDIMAKSSVKNTLVSKPNVVLYGNMSGSRARSENGFTEWCAMSLMDMKAAVLALDRLVDIKVLFCMLGYIKNGNTILVAQTKICEELGMSSGNVSASIRRLSERGILSIERTNGVKVYKVNPHVLWRGNANTHRQLLERISIDQTKELESRRVGLPT